MNHSFWVSDINEDACLVGFFAVLVSVVIVGVGVGMIIWHRSSQQKGKKNNRVTTYQTETDSFTGPGNGLSYV